MEEIDYENLSPIESAAFGALYPVIEDAPEEKEDSSKTSRRVIGISHIPTNTNALVTASEAEERYGIPATRVRRWANRKMIWPVDYRGRHPLYAPPELR